MGISSLGVGSNILTQDVLDQLRSADEAGRVQPIEFEIESEKDKKDAFNIMEAHITNLSDSIEALGTQLLFDERSTEVVGSAVEVTADSNTDIQDFTLVVENLATKQIEQSGQFTSKTETIANAAGTLAFNVGTESVNIDYDDTTTIEDLKDLINEQAGDLVDATVVQVSSGDFRLFLSSVETGASQDISMTDTSGNLKDTRLTTEVDVLTLGLEEDGITPITSTGTNANFTFNGQAIERESNTVDDLISGLDITLKEAGTAVVSVAQNRDNIMEKIDSFVEKYNAAISELERMTKPSASAEDRGIFSGDSTIKGMRRAIEDMLDNIGGGVGSIIDYGFEVSKEGKLSIDKDTFNDALDANASNVEIFFAGGDFDNGDGTTTTVDGVFDEMFTVMETYSRFNGTLDQFKDTIKNNLSSLEDRKETAVERLDAKYEIMKKQYAAYDLMISKINSASSMFVQMANAQSDAQN